MRILFADDTNVFYSSKSYPTLIQTVNAWARTETVWRYFLLTHRVLCSSLNLYVNMHGNKTGFDLKKGHKRRNTFG